MVMIPFFVVAALVATVTSEIQQLACQEGWFLIEERCYLFPEVYCSWPQGREYCTQQNGALATISSQGQQDAIAALSTSDSWIGLSDRKEENNWVWVDGSPYGNYTSWGPGQPDNHLDDLDSCSDDCVALKKICGYEWFDEPCEKVKQVLCSQEPEVVRLTCDEGWEMFEESRCFNVSNVKATYAEAYNDCSEAGGSLAKVESQEVQEFLAALVTDCTLIGLTDFQTEGEFVWDDCIVANYTNWSEGQPDDLNGEDCVEINPYDNSRWNDVDCTARRYYVCEKPVRVVPVIPEIIEEQ